MVKFQSQRGMALIRHDFAVRQSRIKRGLEPDHKTTRDTICPCSQGCTMHTAYNTEMQPIGAVNVVTGEVFE
jgi:hypothetical protein